LAELIVLTVFFAVAASLTHNLLVSLFAILLMASVGLFVGASLASIPERLLPPKAASPLQALFALTLFAVFGALGLILTNSTSSAVIAVAKSQLK
jgi:hypothetical protein